MIWSKNKSKDIYFETFFDEDKEGLMTCLSALLTSFLLIHIPVWKKVVLKGEKIMFWPLKGFTCRGICQAVIKDFDSNGHCSFTLLSN